MVLFQLWTVGTDWLCHIVLSGYRH